MTQVNPRHGWIASLVTATLLSACGGTTPKPNATLRAQSALTVVSSNPTDGDQAVPPGGTVSVTFSDAPDRPSAEGALNFFRGKHDVNQNPSTFTPLTLTAVCAGQWKVTNPNSSAISFGWDFGQDIENGVGIVRPNSEATFYTTKGTQSARLLVGSAVQATKPPSTTACPTTRNLTWSADGKTLTLTPDPATVAERDYTLVVSTGLKGPNGAKLYSPAVIRFRVMPSAQGTVDANGGTVQLGDAKIEIPAGAVDSATTFSLAKLSSPPQPIPGNYTFVTAYKVSTAATALQQELAITIPVGTASTPTDPITELYRIEGGEYVKEQIGDTNPRFLTYAAPQVPETGQTNPAFERIYVVARSSAASLNASYTGSGGTFNGSYGECPEGTESYFGTCRAFPSLISPQRVTTMSDPLYPETHKFISLNAGNTSVYCTSLNTTVAVQNYNAKLCSFAAEERVRNQLINRAKPDFVAVQEFWNNDCSVVPPDANADRVCGPKRKATHQDQRVLDPRIYDTHCAPPAAGGYECIAVRKGVFAFSESSYEVASGYPGAVAANTNYCVDDGKRGRDTGFFGQSVSLVAPKGTDTTSFDVWNAHLATPFGIPKGNRNCRKDQMQALFDAYKSSRRKLLIAGDFNTDYTEKFEGAYPVDAARLRGLASAFGTAVTAFPAVKMGYMISDEKERTAYSLTAVGGNIKVPIDNGGYDHVISNFTDIPAGTQCERLAFAKLDHRTTVCNLYGFDNGKTRSGLLVTDTSGQYPDEFVSSLVTARRKGAKMPFVQWTGTTVHDITLPAGIETEVELSMNCLYATPASKTITVPAGGSASLGTLRIAVYRPYCP